MHKHTKLTPVMRREVYRRWSSGSSSLRALAKEYHIDKKVIQRIIERGRINDFSVHDSANHRYRTILYGLRRLAKTEAALAKRLNTKKQRYERAVPGELVHADTKRLPYIDGETKETKREVLFVGIDDHTRWLIADILPDKTQWSAAVFGNTARRRLPFRTETWYTDNGTEWTGKDTHAFVAFCRKAEIEQAFTKVKHPWTNGKAERVIRTLLTEWFRKNRFRSRNERRRSLYRFVDWYNHRRPHLGINGQTPALRLMSYLQNGDNA